MKKAFIFLTLIATLLLVYEWIKPESTKGRMNVPVVTFGGMQLWNDEILHGGWRVQRNIETQHCRLLDADNVRRAWG